MDLTPNEVAALTAYYADMVARSGYEPDLVNSTALQADFAQRVAAGAEPAAVAVAPAI
jgi:hypothetical protein